MLKNPKSEARNSKQTSGSETSKTQMPKSGISLVFSAHLNLFDADMNCFGFRASFWLTYFRTFSGGGMKPWRKVFSEMVRGSRN